MKRSVEEHVFHCYMPLLSAIKHDINYIGKKMPLPKFDEALLTELIQKATFLFEKSTPLLELTHPICIVGDLHGNIRDLIRILKNLPNKRDLKILFLGDYVDRGQFSLEVITLLYALKIKFPENIFLIRGNHEFLDITKSPGLVMETMFSYGNSALSDIIYESFSWLPIACVIDNKYFCVHGGVSPLLNTLDDIRNIKLPIRDFENELVADLLWSDPNKIISSYMPSPRGKGKLYSVKVVASFLSNNGLKTMIRAHQVVDGVEYIGKKIITVFSSSFVSDKTENRAGVIIYDEDILTSFLIRPLSELKRAAATFQEFPNTITKKLSSLIVLPSLLSNGKMLPITNSRQKILRRGSSPLRRVSVSAQLHPPQQSPLIL